MTSTKGGSRGPSYNHEFTHDVNGDSFRRSSFEPPPDLWSQLLFEGAAKEKAMEIDPGIARAKAAHLWEPRKFLPQALKAPKYVVITPRIEYQKQYMRDYALVGKFLGILPSERDLVKWIHHWWRPKRNYEIQLGSKGFFTIILHNLEDQN